jgi:hypothetical protein
MSYDADYESVYMVVFDSGRTIHVQQFDVEEVKEYCADMYQNDSKGISLGDDGSVKVSRSKNKDLFQMWC